MRRLRGSRWCAAACCALLLAACSAPGSEPSDAATPVPTPDLAQLREQWGLVDCPETDPDATPVDGGLPSTALPCLGTDDPVNLAGLPREPWVINLWAQWCPPCRAESPILREALASIDGVNFLGIDYNDPQPDWAIEFAGTVGWAYPQIQDMDKTLQVPLKVAGLPTTVFVDADGTIAYIHPGELDSLDELEDLIAEHLGEQ